jgi:hypothetical protein
MIEYKRPSSNYTRTETITKNYQTTSFVGAGDSPSSTVQFRGPFDYCIYNNIECRPNGGGERKYTPHPTDPIPVDFDISTYDANAAIWPYRCARPTPAQYVAASRQPHASRGVEVELLEDVDDNPANGNEVIRAGPFVNPAPYIDMVDTVSSSQPNKINAIGTARTPVRVRVDRLRYRVRFRYYVDRFADKQANANSRDEMDVNAQYVLDTPVFDDISVTYFDKVKVLDYREVTE